MIARIARSAPAASPSRTARATSSCSAIASGFGLRRHHAVVGAPGEHLLDHPVERPQHLVAAGLEQRPVEDRVGEQVGVEVARRARDDHVGDRRGQDPALVGVARSAASAAATGSMPRRSSESESSCSVRSPSSRRQRITRGSKTFQRCRAGW